MNWADQEYALSFKRTGNQISSTRDGMNEVTYNVTPCGTWDTLQIAIYARNNSSTTTLSDVALNGVAVVFPGATSVADGSGTEQLVWNISGVDLSGDFELTANATVSGWNAGNENNKIEINVGCDS